VTVILTVVLIQAAFIAGLVVDRAIAPGSLTVTSRPTGAEVFVDGALRATTPATILVNAGKHDLEVRKSGTSERLAFVMTPRGEVVQNVELKPPPSSRTSTGTPGAVSVTVATPAPPAAGWISVVMGVEVQLFERGTLIGRSRTGRIRLAPGRHDLDVVIEALGVRMRKVVNVVAGRTTPLTLDLPQPLDTNAATPGEKEIDAGAATPGGTELGTNAAALGGPPPTDSSRRREDLTARAVIYTERDVDVIPPTIVYPPYLTPVSVGPQQQGLLIIEVIVSEGGTVDSAKALDRPRTMGDVLMLTNELSGSNSWRFRPARRDGEAVRYRQRVVLNHQRP
jgi:hypothetical protein